MRKTLPLLIAGLFAVLFIGGQPASATPKGNIFVAPTGSDSGVNCTRLSSQVFPTVRSTVCLTLGKAYDIASPGDKIIVGNGAYGSQYICRGTSWPSCSESGDRAPPVITFQSETRHGARIVGELQLGSRSGAVSAPSNIVIDGIDVNGSIGVRQANAGVVSRNVTFRNMHVWSLANISYNALVLWTSGAVVGLTYDNMDIGPACCNNDATELVEGPIAYTVPVNVTYSNSTIHDLYTSCATVPANLKSEWGPCTGSFTGAHIDGFQQWGGFRNLKFLNNRFYGFCRPGTISCNGAIFIQCGDPTDGSALYECKNLTIDRNVAVASVPGGAEPHIFSIGTESSAVAVLGLDGRIVVTNNTVTCTSCTSTFAVGAPGGKNGLEPTATMTVSHNVFSSWYYFVGGQCVVYRVSGATYHPTFTDNQIDNHVCD